MLKLLAENSEGSDGSGETLCLRGVGLYEGQELSRSNTINCAVACPKGTR